MDESNYLQQLFINEAKPALQRHSGGSGGLPEGGEPHKQLVTDADGNATWEDRLCWSGYGTAEVIPESKLESDATSPDSFMKPGPYTNVPVDDADYVVVYNGNAYNCRIVLINGYQYLGNVNFFDSTIPSSDEPFAISFCPADMVNNAGFCLMCCPLDGAESVTLQITMQYEGVQKRIDKKYLPEKESAVLKVYVNGSTVLSLSHTHQQMLAAHRAGMVVELQKSDAIYRLNRVQFGNDKMYFTNCSLSGNPLVLWINEVAVTSSNGITVTSAKAEITTT